MTHTILIATDAEVRERWHARFGVAAFATLVDPSALVSPSATVGPGASIGAGAVVQARATVGEGAIVNTRAVVEHDLSSPHGALAAPARALLCARTLTHLTPQKPQTPFQTHRPLGALIDNAALGFNSMSSMLGALPNAAADVARTAAAATSTAAVASTSGLRRWLPWILGALALFLLWNWLSNRSKPEVVPVPAPVVEAPVAAPGVVAPAVVTLPASVYFETGSAMIGDEGQATLAGAAAIVAAEGGNIALTGHTDKTGDAAANEELAKQRAVAVRDRALAACGLR